ncbi:MAG: hypothetical protein EAZ92_09545 [Candidatus Kapaibacterium sp.]|nr:MAG: hypothetical protein EAZ92_09545 [Candidatus Kapabacteria bacterium]
MLTLNLDITPFDQLAFFVEMYGFFPEQQEKGLGIDIGATYRITNNLQVDISGGIGLLGGIEGGFASAGVSWRLPH